MENKQKAQVIKKIIRASKAYGMIDNGDTIAVGVSGGKDSLILLESLATLRDYKKINFNVIAITINLGGKNDYSQIQRLCDRINVEYHVFESDIFEIVFNVRKEKNPCSLCAKMRRGMLCDKAKMLGANKLALGHHADDLVETFMLSLVYEGRLSTFKPVTYMSRSDITVIRPMLLVTEKEANLASKDLPILKNNCPANKHTKRQYVKELIAQINQEVKPSSVNMLNAITHPERYNLFELSEEDK